MKTWAEQIIHFYTHLQFPDKLPGSVQWLYPQQHPEVMQVVKAFYSKYFHDTHRRRLMLGINPGRFGAGVTGVNFTAPRQLKNICGMDHPFKDQSELSAEFIYDMIAAYGGPEQFYQHFFISSVCPLGFVDKGKNLNYYDDKDLYKAVEPFIIHSIEQQLEFPVDRSVCFCIGGEKNLNHLTVLNNRFCWFGKLVPLPHPRFIMQYRRKQKESYIDEYIQKLSV
jgi:Domain of unknown function (DUF4918)